MENFSAGSKKYVEPPKEEIRDSCSDKNRFVAAVLAVFLGCAGVHNFYLGNTKKVIIHFKKRKRCKLFARRLSR